MNTVVADVCISATTQVTGRVLWLYVVFLGRTKI